MAYNFPSSPILNQTYSFNGKTWKWNGYAWDLLQAVFPAASGNNSLILASDGVNYVFVSAPASSDLYARNTANNASNVAILAYEAANTAVTSGQANTGAGLITVTAAYQANVGAGLISTKSAYEANVGAGLITTTAAYQANVGAARIEILGRADSAFGQANLAYTAANTAVTSGQANVGAGLITVTSAYQANVGAGLITVTSAYQANVGAGLITITSAYQANVGAARIEVLGRADSAFIQANNASNVAALAYDTANAKVSKAGDTMSGALTASALTANSTVTINTSSSQGATTIVTSSTAQIALDSFSTSAFRSAKYFVQMTSGTAYHIIELNLVHDDTTAYLAQYGEIKTGSELGVFDAIITTGTLNLLLTPNNAITTIKASFTKLAV